MKKILTLFAIASLLACNSNSKTDNNVEGEQKQNSIAHSSGGHYEGAFTNGMKETYISFDISENGEKLENLTFKGYWRCDGSLEHTTMGPGKSFAVQNNKVDGQISEPEDGGATGTRYELRASINGNKAEGTFRMNINALACDTYLLNWTAEKK
jgi:hypothetical protein